MFSSFTLNHNIIAHICAIIIKSCPSNTLKGLKITGYSCEASTACNFPPKKLATYSPPAPCNLKSLIHVLLFLPSKCEALSHSTTYQIFRPVYFLHNRIICFYLDDSNKLHYFMNYHIYNERTFRHSMSELDIGDKF